jgi:hypothetical protein
VYNGIPQHQHIFIGDFAGLENKFEGNDLKTVRDFLSLKNNNDKIVEPFYFTEMIPNESNAQYGFQQLNITDMKTKIDAMYRTKIDAKSSDENTYKTIAYNLIETINKPEVESKPYARQDLMDMVKNFNVLNVDFIKVSDSYKDLIVTSIPPPISKKDASNDPAKSGKQTNPHSSQSIYKEISADFSIKSNGNVVINDMKDTDSYIQSVLKSIHMTKPTDDPTDVINALIKSITNESITTVYDLILDKLQNEKYKKVRPLNFGYNKTNEIYITWAHYKLEVLSLPNIDNYLTNAIEYDYNGYKQNFLTPILTQLDVLKSINLENLEPIVTVDSVTQYAQSAPTLNGQTLSMVETQFKNKSAYNNYSNSTLNTVEKCFDQMVLYKTKILSDIKGSKHNSFITNNINAGIVKIKEKLDIACKSYEKFIDNITEQCIQLKNEAIKQSTDHMQKLKINAYKSTESYTELTHNILSNCMISYLNMNRYSTINDMNTDKVLDIYNAIKPIFESLHQQLEQQFLLAIYGKYICDIRSEEGKYINESVAKTCQEIIDIVNYKNKGSAYNSPDYIQKCLSSYCMLEPYTCLATSNVESLKQYDQIMAEGSIFKKMFECVYPQIENETKQEIHESFYRDITLCIMCVFNITKDDKIPKNFYIDIYDLKREYLEYVYTLNNYLQYINMSDADKALVNEHGDLLIKKLKEHCGKILIYMCYTYDKIRNYAKDIRLDVINLMKQIDVNNQYKLKKLITVGVDLISTGAYPQNMEEEIKSNTIQDSLDLTEIGVTNHTNFKDVVKQIIDLININNNSTPIGTLTFVDELSKYNQTNINCRLKDHNIDRLGHANMYDRIDILNQKGGNVLNEVYSSDRKKTHSKSKRNLPNYVNKTYKHYM